MKYSLMAFAAGFFIDLVIGDPHAIMKSHPVVWIGRLISVFERVFRGIFPKTKGGERLAGLAVWILTAAICFAVPFFLLKLFYGISVWLGLAIEALMCWRILAVKALKDESIKVFKALKKGSLEDARYAVSMIVGRDTERLDEAGVARAAVETVAENCSDGVIAPMIFIAIGGAPLGFFYKAVNTMDSMLGYIEPPYTNLGFFPAKLDDVFNWIPARLSALLMLAAGGILGLDAKNGLRIFRRDRYKHASPNSAQTESVCAGLMGLELAGDAWYHGILSKKEHIGDPVRPIEPEDIPLACRLMYVSALLGLIVLGTIKFFI